MGTQRTGVSPDLLSLVAGLPSLGETWEMDED